MSSLVRNADALLHRASRKAIALNYVDHAAEMGAKADRAAPSWFFKPASSYLPENGGAILLPKDAVVHHEVELGVVIGRRAQNVKAADAIGHIGGYVCAIDVTARNWQAEAKAGGRPWSLCKGCDTFLPVSDIVPADAIKIGKDGTVDVTLFLDVNDDRRQYASTKNMVWTIPELIEHISRYVTLDEWDLILTGTPSGIGPIKHGDVVHAGIEGLVDMSFQAEDKT